MRNFARISGALSALMALAAMAGPSTAADSPTLSKIKSSGAITIGYREASIPFSYLGSDQKPIGFSLDLCAAVVERVKVELGLPNLNVNYTPVNSSNRIPLIQSGTVDIECGGTANDKKRQEQVSFSVTTFVSQPRWLVKADSGLKTAGNLKGKTIVVTQGSNAVGFAQGVNAKEQLGLNIVQAKDHAESFLMLNTGRAAAFMEDDILLAGLKAAAPKPDALIFLPEGYARIYYGLMFTKGDAGFKALVDDVLSKQMASGQFEKTYAKWFTRPIPPKGENLAFPLTETLMERIAHPSDAVD
ncbi:MULTISPECIES: amino acid ABC transporter substrate-binding protein [unclassified Bradyrhizobium]|uniref:amino acid ABC transporter substrate-binding protein n=1 Tax=unclassified Bradyrhizobium TaxID=2631580 RepID=UPI00247AA8A4|nr:MULTISPECIES: amino acid ABC transporter substrate-binding protein [unclassified Bradyrhizobium]WGR69550.1 amino acid ABC transporter substrate-binding protein [Bradyrhizobium sp. ISRA426]WGR81606.1 amino acid ABC transporter substrate-binding protein [Bradyrhizobium sp. ISRA430]WGR84790.1 amino acid ABC transporter substrate-binding protein [Bradyrhizobium sp. ISRA432]